MWCMHGATAKNGINLLYDSQSCLDFVFDLIFAAKDVAIVLLKATNSGQSSEGARKLVSMQNTEIGITNRLNYNKKENQQDGLCE